MSRHDRYPLPSEEEFELVANRYIVVPGALWGVAMVVALLVALTQSPPAEPIAVTPEAASVGLAA